MSVQPIPIATLDALRSTADITATAHDAIMRYVNGHLTNAASLGFRKTFVLLHPPAVIPPELYSAALNLVIAELTTAGYVPMLEKGVELTITWA